MTAPAPAKYPGSGSDTLVFNLLGEGRRRNTRHLTQLRQDGGQLRRDGQVQMADIVDLKQQAEQSIH